VTGRWRTLCSEEYHYLYCLPNIISDRIKLLEIAVNPERKTPFGRLRGKWSEEIKTDLK
jgi:hypothetical protein